MVTIILCDRLVTYFSKGITEVDTRERILEKALEMFAENGYNGTNLRDLAESLGLSKSALYRHFSSKEEIASVLFERLGEYYESNFGSARKLPAIPDSMEEFHDMVMNMVNFTINDRKIILSRKIISSEQYRFKNVSDLATKNFYSGTLNLFSVIFARMMEKGLLKNEDPHMMALGFSAPITSLIHMCDREPEKKDEIIEEIENLTEYYIHIYGNEEKR